MASGTIALAIAIMMGLCVFGPAIAQGLVASKAMESIARQPEAAGQIRSSMILALGLNLLGITKIKVSDYAPAIFLAPVVSGLFAVIAGIWG